MRNEGDSTLLNQRSAYIIYEIRNMLHTLRFRRHSRTCIIPVQGHAATTSPHQPLRQKAPPRGFLSPSPSCLASKFLKLGLSSSPSKSVSPFDSHGYTAGKLFLGPPPSTSRYPHPTRTVARGQEIRLYVPKMNGIEPYNSLPSFV